MSSKPKVAFVLPSMAMGGVSKMLLDILDDLKDCALNVEILLLNKGGDLLGSLPEWVTVRQVAGMSSTEGLRQHVSEVLNRLGLKRIFHLLKSLYHRFGHLFICNKKSGIEEGYDVVVAFQDGIATWYTAKNIHGKYNLAVIHTDFEQAQYDAAAEKRQYECFDGIFCTSASARASFLRCLPSFVNRTKILLPRIDANELTKMANISSGIELSPDSINIVTVARLSHEKGIDTALQVLAKLVAKRYNVKWFFVGNGIEENKLQLLATKLGCENHAVFVGRLDNPYELMLKADIYVQPSKYESYCIALAEARALGCAIVTTDFPSAHEQLDHDDGLITGTTVDSLYEGVCKMIDDPRKRKEFAVNSKRSFCGDMYINNRLVQEIKDFLKGRK